MKSVSFISSHLIYTGFSYISYKIDINSHNNHDIKFNMITKMKLLFFKLTIRSLVQTKINHRNDYDLNKNTIL